MRVVVLICIALVVLFNGWMVMLAWGMAYSYGAVAGTLSFSQAIPFGVVLGMGVGGAAGASRKGS